MSDDRKHPPELTDIEARLRKVRPKEVGRGDTEREGPERPSGLGLAFRIGIELVTTVLVGGGIGYALDTWLGTLPLLMVVFIVLGGAAGVMNVYRVVKGLDDTVGLGRAIDEKKRQDGPPKT